MKFNTASLSAFAALAAAAPSTLDKRCGNQLAVFDGQPSVSTINGVAPVPTFKGLTYTSFNVLQQGADGITPVGVKPQSGQNVASNAITDGATTGTPSFAIANGLTSFDPLSLFFGCEGTSALGAAGVPLSCTITFTAYKAGSGTPFGTIDKQFKPSNAVSSKMAKAVFPKTWTGLGKVEVTVAQGTAVTALNGLLIDNISYKLNP